MKVILTQHVASLGQKGEIKEVSEGYFRNMLAPRKLAVVATDKNISNLKQKKDKAVEELENMKESANAIKTKIDGKQIKLKEKVSDTGHLYAAVSQKEIKAALREILKVDIPVKQIKMDEAIKEVGSFTIRVELYKGVTAYINLNVSSE